MSYKYLQNDKLYKTMRDGGATPHQIYARAKQDGAMPMAALKILRDVFGLSLVEAKEIWVQAEELAPSLWDYQEQLSLDIQEALDAAEEKPL